MQGAEGEAKIFETNSKKYLHVNGSYSSSQPHESCEVNR